MYEEPTSENLQMLIDKVPYQLNSLERLILCNEGTVQTLLSVLFMVPIRIEVISQKEIGSVIVRWVRLVAEYAPDNVQTVCLAESIIDMNSGYEGFINGIKEKHFGIGQLISSLKIKTTRSLLGFYSDDSVFSRTYEISADKTCAWDKCLSIIITEVFPKERYKKLCPDLPNLNYGITAK
ncbi:MAG: hypothetical protein O8C67_04950 [Candidatus Methanoperedens sp.]|nr:hypothetical protein [Candidatus Methanoperedens sp.]